MKEMPISFLLNSLVREMNSQADALLRQKFEMTYSQFAFLMRIRESESIDITRLAEALGVTKGAVSKRLAWFTERDLVKSDKFPGNAKRVMVCLTKKGLKLSESAANFLEVSFLRAISKAKEIDQAALKSELQKMLELLKEKRSSEKI